MTQIQTQTQLQYMLLFSLGPVQPFIAQARKTRDLWLGSFLLSALMQASMQDIHSHLIFPSKPRIEGNIPDLPNKYIALFATAKEATEAAKKSEENIITFWRDIRNKEQSICNDVWNRVLKGLPVVTSGTGDQWDRQTNPANLFDIFWIVVKGDEDHYDEWLTETQYLFDRRKHLRNFQKQDEAGEKSTISGQRTALRGAGEWRTDVQTFWYEVAKLQSPKDISQDGTERLDAIDTVKRFAYLSHSFARLVGHPISQSFPSTSSIATASYVEQLIPVSEDAAVSAVLSTWLQESKKLGDTMEATIPLLIELAKKHKQHGSAILGRDGDCFFPETFSENRLKKEFGFSDQHKDARKLLAKEGPKVIEKLLKATDALTPPLTHPTPYYAMIQMDGDKMGKLINGVQTRGEHQAISAALSTFSRGNVPNLVEGGYPGKLIYAGGDDVFALAPIARDALRISGENGTQPIKTVLNLVDQLQQQYRATVQRAVVDTPPTDASPPPEPRKATMSAGVAIAHHYTALSYVRRVSKEAEQLAKNHYGRNALVVTVLRRSGEQTRVGCKWQYSNPEDETQLIEPIPLFSFFYNLFVTDVLAPSCVYTLLEEAPALVAMELEARKSEIRRILHRQRDPRKEANFPDELLREKAGQLVALAAAMDKSEHPKLEEGQTKAVDLEAEGRRYGLVEMLGWLLVMLFLARKEGM